MNRGTPGNVCMSQKYTQGIPTFAVADTFWNDDWVHTMDDNNIDGKKNDIRTLINQLSVNDGLIRQDARLTLVEMREQAVPWLVEALTSKSKNARWEAAKALGSISSPSASFVLVKALEDDDSGVRWLAADALIALGVASIVPLLEALNKRPKEFLLREGAGRVLTHVTRDTTGKIKEALEPVIAALNSPDTTIVAAEAALTKLNN